MKNNLLIPVIFAVGFTSIAKSVQCQSDKFVYAVTDSVRGGVKWNYLRNIDLRTGSFGRILIGLNNDMTPPSDTGPYNGVAAIAYDKESKRVYYTLMYTDRLGYIELKEMRNHIVTNNFTGLDPKATNQSNIFTRMVIAGDRNGYALTNDGRHLIRFTTGKNPVITDLGSLVDDPENKEMSVHNLCSSYGGDLIAEKGNHLYLFTSANHFFKINTVTKVAKYMGTINGLPAKFTTSGAAVNDGNQVILISAVEASDIYAVDINTLAASRLYIANSWYTSDLANSNVLGKSNNNNKEPEMLTDNTVRNDSIQLVPNPVTSGEFKIQFGGIRPGQYTVYVIDAGGQVVVRRNVEAGGKTSYSAGIRLPGKMSKGLFVVRITDQGNRTVFNDKIIVQ